MPRLICDIADDIRKQWAKPHYAAVPYLSAMRYVGTGSDTYGLDSGKSIVAYFLGNASTFRGDEAKRLKAELKQAAGIK